MTGQLQEPTMAWHEPIMVEQVLELLQVEPGKVYCDGTLGGGGHSERILQASAPDGRLVGIDQDPAALARSRQVLAAHGDRVTLTHGNFADVVEILTALGMAPVDGLLVDLGVSSHQLDTADRGFSFRKDGPLDMRMDTTGGQQAREFIEQSSEAELAWVIQSYGEERASRRVARAIKQAQEQGGLEGTADLARVVRDAVPARDRRGKRIHPATRTFQALRMAVNQELDALERFLQSFDKVLRPGGRVAVIAFHSLEDRAVKRRFASMANPCTCPPGLPVCGCGLEPAVSLITRKPVRPDDQEVAENPRARSARLRAVEVL